jgi:hypothetical protein
MLKQTLIAIALLLPSHASAQDSELVHDFLKRPPSPGAAMSYGMFDALAGVNYRHFDLSEEQMDLLRVLKDDFRVRHKKLRAVQQAVRSGEVAMTPEELANVDREIAALEDETLNSAKGMLSADQWDSVRDQVLRGRLRRYGLVGLLTADEVNIDLETSVSEVVQTVMDVQNQSKDELVEVLAEFEQINREYKKKRGAIDHNEEVLAEFEKIRAEYMKKIAATQRKQFELALIRLGDDGEKIRKLLESLKQKEGGKDE